MTPLYPPASEDPRSILVVLPTWVGDFVMATPSLRAIRERFPRAHITLLMEANLLDLAVGLPWGSECIALPPRGRRTVFHRPFRKLVWQLRSRKYDLAFLLSNSFRSAFLTRLSGARRRVGYDRDGRGWLLTNPIPVPNRRGRELISIRDLESLKLSPMVRRGEKTPGRVSPFVPLPLVDYYGHLVQQLGCPPPGDRLQLFTTQKAASVLEDRLGGILRAGGPLVVLSPGAKFGASKCWPPHQFAATADRLSEEVGARILISCGPGEEPIARAIASAMRRENHLLINPLLTLGEFKALLSRSDLLICNDAGPRHIAKAFGVAVVTVFGPTHPDWTATNYPMERIVRVDVDCGPCQQRTCPLGHHQCMEVVTADMVTAAARELLTKKLQSTCP